MTIPARLLLGPGPSPVTARVMDAMRAPVLSHLDPAMMTILDDLRARLSWIFGAAEGSFSFAVSGTGTAGMETAVANVTEPGTRALVVVTGYFGDRLAQMFGRYGAVVRRVEVDWGRACDPAQVDRALKESAADIVAIVHAETSTGVVNPVEAIARLAQQHGALTLVDAVTSLGALPVETGTWGVDVCYSCTQKGLGAPSGLSPICFSPRALAQRVASRSFYLDLTLLEEYWVRRKYHHTVSAPLVYALREALIAVEEEGLAPRAERHRRNHLALASGLERIGLSLLPPESERLWTLNAVRVPATVDEAQVRQRLLADAGIEIGAGLGPLAGRIWRVGLMGSGSTEGNVRIFLDALPRAIAAGSVTA
jgi:alanine-glyoxylate transaminase/serine-glyoxylate transaminase/serine-pyruvate transaminase